MKVTKHIDGVTCWMDLASGDRDASVQFYSGLFGWTAQMGSDETGGYRQCQVNGQSVAGIGSKMSPEQPTVWTIYFMSSDVDATIAAATKLGATTIMPGMDVMEFGRMAILLDPSGAAFGVWQPYEMWGTQLVDEHGSWAWSELLTSDVDGALKFYGELFGWTRGPATPDNPEYCEMKIGELSVTGITARPTTMPAEIPNFWGLYFTIDDLDKGLAYVQSSGGHLAVGPMDIPYGRFAQFVDPQGAMVGILEPKKA